LRSHAFRQAASLSLAEDCRPSFPRPFDTLASIRPDLEIRLT
jgi:hypothetical protein